MAESSRQASLPSRTLAVLLAVFLAACVLGYLAVREAVNRTMEQQALAIAEAVASQAASARSVYAGDVADKLARDGFGAAEDWSTRPGHVPLPAEFLQRMGQASSAGAERLYAYRPVGPADLRAGEGPDQAFLRWAWPQLHQPGQPGPATRQQVSRFEEQDGRRVLRLLAADAAAPDPTPPPASAHSAPGALLVTIALERAAMLAGSEVQHASALFFVILLASFAALGWLNCRLQRQKGHLRRAERDLARSELQTRDAEELLAAKQGVEQAFARLSSTMRGIDQHALVSVTDVEGRIVEVNEKFVQASGYTREELIGQGHELLSSGVHDSDFYPGILGAIQRGDVWRSEICQRAKDGRLYWVDTAIVPIDDAAGEPQRHIAISIDITAQRRHEEVLHYRATHDALTGLPNRVLLLERLGRAIAKAQQHRHRVVLFFVDLDKFKQINDSLGHAAGDQVLCEMARRLRALARGRDTVARLGGDEFVLACANLQPRQIATMSERICQALLTPVALAAEQHVLGGSVGVAMFPEHGDDGETLIKRADIAMYQAKTQGGGEVRVFAPEMQDAIDARLQMLTRLREGISRGEMVLHYQPQVDYETGALVGVEALLRWQSPDYGLLMPNRFIALAEESRLIEDIDSFVLDAVCLQMRRWHDAGHGWVRSAVNLSAGNFSDPAFKPLVTGAMARHGIPAGVLELEVTESLALRDPQAALAQMHELKELGVLLSIDDFGTGYSNLGYLKQFPADRLKVDQSFVRGLSDNPQDRAIVAAVVRMAHHLNMRAIAEGVETEEQALMLYSLQVDELQGYWMARPMPADDVQQLFDHQTLLDPARLLQRDAQAVVLLVEDEEITRAMVENLVTALGVQVVATDSAEAALELFHKHPYAAAIVDHRLPGDTGITLLGQMRKRLPRTVRVLMTASAEPQVLRDAINIGGVAHFLPKPIEPAAVRKVVLEACWTLAAQRRGQGATSRF